MKRLGNHVGPFTHNVVTGLVKDRDASLHMHADEAFLVAKQLLADLPLIPTGERVYDLTHQIQNGLLKDICPIENVHDSIEVWQQCLDATEEYLKGIGIWEQFDTGDSGKYSYTPKWRIPQC